MDRIQEYSDRALQIARAIKDLQADLDNAKADFQTATIGDARLLQQRLCRIARLAENLRWTDCGLQFRTWY